MRKVLRNADKPPASPFPYTALAFALRDEHFLNGGINEALRRPAAHYESSSGFNGKLRESIDVGSVKMNKDRKLRIASLIP